MRFGIGKVQRGVRVQVNDAEGTPRRAPHRQPLEEYVCLRGQMGDHFDVMGIGQGLRAPAPL
jgi:hypothetical protein